MFIFPRANRLFLTAVFFLSLFSFWPRISVAVDLNSPGRKINTPDVKIVDLTINCPESGKAVGAEEILGPENPLMATYIQAGGIEAYEKYVAEPEKKMAKNSCTPNIISGRFFIKNNEEFWNGNVNYKLALIRQSPADEPLNLDSNIIADFKNEKPIVLDGNNPVAMDFSLSYPPNIPAGDYLFILKLFRRDNTVLDAGKKEIKIFGNGGMTFFNDIYPVDERGNKKYVFNGDESINLFFSPNGDLKGDLKVFLSSAYSWQAVPEKIYEGKITAAVAEEASVKLPPIKKPGKYILGLSVFNSQNGNRLASEGQVEIKINGPVLMIADVFREINNKTFIVGLGGNKIKIGVSAFSLPEPSEAEITLNIYGHEGNNVYSHSENLWVYNADVDPHHYFFEYEPEEEMKNFTAEAILSRDNSVYSRMEYKFGKMVGCCLSPEQNLISGEKSKRILAKAAFCPKIIAATAIFILTAYFIYFIISFHKRKY